jgi:mannosyltransferase
MGGSLWRWRALTFAAVVVAFALRVWTLGAQSFWFDEGWSWHLATLPLGVMVDTTAGDRSPVLYYALLHGWINAAGLSEFAQRYLSTCADLIALAGVAALARRIAGPSAGVAAAWLYAIYPGAVWYAQETRMYAQVAALCTLSTLCLWRWRDRADNRALLASAVLLAAAIHSHYYAVFLLPGHALFALTAALGQPGALRKLGAWCAAALGIVAVVVPWLLYARRGFGYNDGFKFPLNTVDGRLLEWLRWFASGGLAVETAVWQWALLGIAIGLTLGMLAAGRRGRDALGLLALIVTPLLAATIAVRLFFPYNSVFHARYLIYVAPLAIVALTAALPRGARQNRLMPFVGLICGALVWLPMLTRYLREPALQRDDTRAAVRHVVEALEPGDAVIMSRDNFAVTYYWPPALRDRFAAAPDGLQGVLASDQIVLDKLRARASRRVRLMLWQDAVVDPERLLETTLWANGRQLGEYNFGQIRLPLYQIDAPIPTALPLASVPGDATFAAGADRIRLARSWHSPACNAGDWCYVALEWQAETAITTDYKVFVHVLGPDGALAFQQDKLALNDLLPTSTWRTGQPRRDPYAIIVPAELPAGRYTVRVGLYEPASGARMTLSSGDALTIGALEISR